jgi:NAD(P)-dependent dehydrogenase (short-subunit alcohol dehydrogenase family)
LTEALLPILARGPARVVNAASAAHAMRRGDPLADIQFERSYLGLRAYARATLLNLLWTFALARRPGGSGVVANATNPGTAWTTGTPGRRASRRAGCRPCNGFSGRFFAGSNRAAPRRRPPDPRPSLWARRRWRASRARTTRATRGPNACPPSRSIGTNRSAPGTWQRRWPHARRPWRPRETFLEW